MADSIAELINKIAPGDPVLPKHAYMPINRCNFPAIILGSLTFQRYPEAILIDHVMMLHKHFFEVLKETESSEKRALMFDEYMQVSFLLGHPEDAGFEQNKSTTKRHKLDYKRLLRGWMFDSDSREGAVLKGWAESRFGLVARNHKGPLREQESPAYTNYIQERCLGLYNTNSLESQLDLLYTFTQFELQKRFPEKLHYPLYRGTNALDQYEALLGKKGAFTILLNNLTSFSSDPELCDGFGDYIFQCNTPFSKILFFPELIPNILKFEKEHIVIGGLYKINII